MSNNYWNELVWTHRTYEFTSVYGEKLISFTGWEEQSGLEKFMGIMRFTNTVYVYHSHLYEYKGGDNWGFDDLTTGSYYETDFSLLAHGLYIENIVFNGTGMLDTVYIRDKMQ
jgi:hypothetical protein